MHTTVSREIIHSSSISELKCDLKKTDFHMTCLPMYLSNEVHAIRSSTGA